MDVIAELLDSLFAKIIAALLTPFIAGLAYFLLRRAYRGAAALRFSEAALRAVAREEKDGIRKEGAGFWLKQPNTRPANYENLRGNSIPIVMVAATKGGVGKTSLSGSLAAHFAQQWTQRRQNPNLDLPLRVLVIDQDYQGSFTTLTVHVNSRYAQPSKSNRLVSGELGSGGVVGQAERISQDGMENNLSIWTIPAYYDLAQAENRMLVEWLLPLSERSAVSRLLQFLGIREPDPPSCLKDLRYILAEALLDPHVHESFDLIIIDSPPRLTTSHIQAMCASTHLLVPTILDGLSGDAVARYLDQVATHKLGPTGEARRAICPHLQPVGVVCTMVPQTGRDLSGPLNELRARIAAARLQPEIVPESCFIHHRTPYRDHAGERIAYASIRQDAQHRDLRTEVDRLGDWLAPKLGATVRGWKRREG